MHIPARQAKYLRPEKPARFSRAALVLWHEGDR